MGISGCGRAAGLAAPGGYAAHGHAEALPTRRALAALNVPGTIAGWEQALKLVPEGRRLPLPDLLSPAIRLARDGIAVTGNQSRTTAEKLSTLKGVPGFGTTFLVDGAPPPAGHRLRQPALAATLSQLAEAGLDDFYRGDIAERHAAFHEAEGSPLRLSDFHLFAADRVATLTVDIRAGRLFNMTPPTQGVASLTILALFDRLGVTEAHRRPDGSAGRGWLRTVPAHTLVHCILVAAGGAGALLQNSDH